MKKMLALLLCVTMLLPLAARAFADGDPAALGFACLEGSGVPQDYGKARLYFLEAAEAGDTEVLYPLGELYENGSGVERDYIEAVRWYVRAEDAGDARAIAKLKTEPFRSIAEAMGVHEQATRLSGTVGDTEGVHGATHPIYLDDPVIEAVRISVLLILNEWLSGWPFGNWRLWVRNPDGTWRSAGDAFRIDEFQRTGQPRVYVLDLDDPATFTAVALCPADKGMDFAVRFETHFFVDEANVGEYSDSLPKPDFTPAASQYPVASSHFYSPAWTNPFDSDSYIDVPIDVPSTGEDEGGKDDGALPVVIHVVDKPVVTDEAP